ncbi:MAG: zf-HC2 domain-containing protein [Acidobacteria bacterium]|nr:zf-HC2 domain-containing protein [Acidobacteriota bacterium]
MTCRQVIRQLSEYLDQELEPGLAEQLARHLEHCEDCKLVVDTTRKTVKIYCNTEPMDLPPAVRERLERALTERLKDSR